MSSSHPSAAPQAAEETILPAAAPTTPTPAPAPRSFSRPTTANANANVASNDAAATAPINTTVPTTTSPVVGPQAVTTAGDPSLTFNEKLNAGDRYWKFKFALMAILIITGLIGIGCFAWLIASVPAGSDYDFGYDSYSYLWYSFITWSVSIIWCVVCILVFVVRKRTVHPGVRVTLDLLLWLAFIITALFSVLGLLVLMSFGEDGTLEGYFGYGNNGEYVLAANNTWVWQQDSSYISYPRDCTSTSNSYSQAGFANCDAQDAYVNRVWHDKPHRVNVELTGVVCQFFGLVLHFALFVWACVDTNHRNRTKVSKDAEKLAAEIVQTMITNGAVVPPPGQAYVRPAMGQAMYYQLPPQQGYPMQPMYMEPAQGPQPMGHQKQQQQPTVPVQYPMGQRGMSGPATGAAGPSNEKGKGARYA